VTAPQPGSRPYPARFVNYSFWLVLFSVICFAIAAMVGMDWITESGKVADVLVFIAGGGFFFALAHIW
jgi:uncharacterized membrane protein